MVNVALSLPLVDAAITVRETRRRNSDCADLWKLLDEVMDPEIPVLSLWDLGVLRDVTLQGETVEVTLSPTYTGCPAFDVMASDITAKLTSAGYPRCTVKTELSPAWHSGWISARGRQALLSYGIAPPGERCNGCSPALGTLKCPQCGSTDTACISEFGSTACKAQYRCHSCGEPFDYFKAL
ncbi:MAG: 1,2-phenylacetyl-CoA epoxidase subunit PaaD [Pseudomonadota bacterium]